MDSSNITPQVLPQYKAQQFPNPQAGNLPQNFPMQPLVGQFPITGLNRQYPTNQFMPQAGNIPQMMPFGPEGQMRFPQPGSVLIASA